MKSNAAKLFALLLACFSAGAADISFNLQDFQTGPIGTKRVSIFPLMTPTVSGSAVITSDRIAYTTAADGTFTATNMVPGTYRVEVLGPYGTTTFYIVTGATNANAIDLTTAATNLVSGFTAYSTLQSDNLFARKTNGAAYGLRFPSGAVSNYVWTCTNATTGQGAWVAASGGSSTNGGTVTSLSVTSQTLTVTGSPVTTAGTITLEVPTSLTNGFVRADVTNGLASIGYVNASTNGFVYASVTNGLASQSYAQSLTNGFLRTNEIQAGSNVSIAYDTQNRPVISSTGSGGSVDTNAFLGINSTNVGGYSLSITNTDSTIHLYSLLTDASNYRRLAIKKSGNDFLIGSEAAGSGVGNGALTFMTGGTNRFTVSKDGNLVLPVTKRIELSTYNDYITSPGDSSLSIYAGNYLSAFFNYTRVSFPGNTYYAGTSLAYPNIGSAMTTDLNNVGTTHLYINSQQGYDHNTKTFSTPGGIVVQLGKGGNATSTGNSGGDASSLTVLLKPGGLGIGSGTNGSNSYFLLKNTNLHNVFSVDYSGTTTIGTNAATATVFNPTGSGTNLINGFTTISNLFELTVSGSRGKSVTNTWYSKDELGSLTITNLQIFKEGVLTSWKTNGVEL